MGTALVKFEKVQVERVDEETLLMSLLNADGEQLLTMEPTKVAVGETYIVDNVYGAVKINVMPA